MTPPPLRGLAERIADTRHRLENDVDAWVASADPQSGEAHLVPLSFLWDGDILLFATPASSPTGRNLSASGRARVGIGPTRDVVLVEGSADAMPPADLPAEIGDAFAAATGFDPRGLTTAYVYFRIRPERVQAWREANELEGRELMRGGRWALP
jgi:Pyridoxamine 5'-phosphate oxidase